MATFILLFYKLRRDHKIIVKPILTVKTMPGIIAFDAI